MIAISCSDSWCTMGTGKEGNYIVQSYKIHLCLGYSKALMFYTAHKIWWFIVAEFVKYFLLRNVLQKIMHVAFF